MGSAVYSGVGIDADAQAAVNHAVRAAVQAATDAHPAGFTITAVSHDSQILTVNRTVEPNFFGAAMGGRPSIVQDQSLLVTAVIVIQEL